MRNKEKILVFCHDAGGAEIISSYIKHNLDKYDFICLPIGPAKAVFAKKKLNYLIPKQKNPYKYLALKDLKMVLLGTSWINFEWLKLIEKAKKMGIKAVVYLDHWMNYRGRFKANYSEKNFPSEFWTGDKHAFYLAKKVFPDRMVKLEPNCYFKDIKKEFKNKKGAYKGRANKVLFLSDPTSVFWKRAKIRFNEMDLLGKILKCLSDKNKEREVIIRFHPSDDRTKYKEILKKYSGRVKIIKSSNKDILDDIVKAGIVIGLESMSQVISYLCGKKTISCSFNPKRKCTLPFPGIIKIENLDKLNKYL
ncbi:MAG: hypothetical protein PHN74_01740 [Candidatus Pacebacteria bacterium]|nr:hypothetical protein [Candidatus Paceibacterota bacterium]